MTSEAVRENPSCVLSLRPVRRPGEECHFETLADYHDWRELGRTAAAQVLGRRDRLLWVSGNHLGVLPVLEELGRLDPPPLVVQLDAHLDIYNLSDCTAELSNGNFLLHADEPLPPLVNFGHRELLLRPDYIADHFRHVFAAAELALDPGPALVTLAEECRAAGRVFVDLDCDVFDPAFFPAVAQPQPFGLSPPLLLRILDALAAVPLAGLAISEFDPSRDERDRSLALLMWLIEYLLLRLYEK
jgi:agmatinase